MRSTGFGAAVTFDALDGFPVQVIEAEGVGLGFDFAQETIAEDGPFLLAGLAFEAALLDPHAVIFEMFLADLLAVDKGYGEAVGQPGTELLPEVQGQGGPAWAVGMEEADEGTQAGAGQGGNAVVPHEGVEEGEQAIDAVAWDGTWKKRIGVKPDWKRRRQR